MLVKIALGVVCTVSVLAGKSPTWACELSVSLIIWSLITDFESLLSFELTPSGVSISGDVSFFWIMSPFSMALTTLERWTGTTPVEDAAWLIISGERVLFSSCCSSLMSVVGWITLLVGISVSGVDGFDDSAFAILIMFPRELSLRVFELPKLALFKCNCSCCAKFCVMFVIAFFLHRSLSSSRPPCVTLNFFSRVSLIWAASSTEETEFGTIGIDGVRPENRLAVANGRWMLLGRSRFAREPGFLNCKFSTRGGYKSYRPRETLFV